MSTHEELVIEQQTPGVGQDAKGHGPGGQCEASAPRGTGGHGEGGGEWVSGDRGPGRIQLLTLVGDQDGDLVSSQKGRVRYRLLKVGGTTSMHLPLDGCPRQPPGHRDGRRLIGCAQARSYVHTWTVGETHGLTRDQKRPCGVAGAPERGQYRCVFGVGHTLQAHGGRAVRRHHRGQAQVDGIEHLPAPYRHTYTVGAYVTDRTGDTSGSAIHHSM